MERDFSTISPSAKALLFMKGITDIPFAHDAAALMAAPGAYVPDLENKDVRFWARVMHFEERYKSIDLLLAQQAPKQVMELSSGFSFRGLAAVTTRENIHYIDTDLPDIIDTKRSFIPAFTGVNLAPGCTLETLPLNALDEEHFLDIAAHFDQGPIAIVNEGLMMYLNTEEKEKLCNTIIKILKARGGCWITGDIYAKIGMGREETAGNDQLSEFLKEHNTEENKFDSFGAAAAFFNRMGLVVDSCVGVGITNLSSFKYFEKIFPPEQVRYFKMTGKMRETWCLRLAE